MSDQAETLRKLMSQRRANTEFAQKPPLDAPVAREERRAPVITVASGKGGVGKSCLTSHLGTYLARAGKRVLLVDGDFGLANLDIMLGVQPGATLEQVLDGQARLQDAIVGIEPNLWLLPAASGLIDFRSSSLAARERLTHLFADCPWEMDLVLLDVGAGIQANVLSLHSPVFKSVIVLTPDPTSLTDAYGLIKILSRETAVSEFYIVVNQVADGREARAIYQRLKDVADRFIDVRMELLGHWEKNEKITQSVMKRKILLDYERGEGANHSLCSLGQLAARIEDRILDTREEVSEVSVETVALASREVVMATNLTGNMAGFWRVLLGAGSDRVAAGAILR